VGIEGDTHAVCKDQLSDVEVFIHLLKSSLDATKFFAGCLLANHSRGCPAPGSSPVIVNDERQHEKDGQAR